MIYLHQPLVVSWFTRLSTSTHTLSRTDKFLLLILNENKTKTTKLFFQKSLRSSFSTLAVSNMTKMAQFFVLKNEIRKIINIHILVICFTDFLTHVEPVFK